MFNFIAKMAVFTATVLFTICTFATPNSIQLEQDLNGYSSKFSIHTKNLLDMTPSFMGDKNNLENLNEFKRMTTQIDTATDELLTLVRIRNDFFDNRDIKLVSKIINFRIKYMRKETETEISYINTVLTYTTNIALASEGRQLRDDIQSLQTLISE